MTLALTKEQIEAVISQLKPTEHTKNLILSILLEERREPAVLSDNHLKMIIHFISFVLRGYLSEATKDTASINRHLEDLMAYNCGYEEHEIKAITELQKEGFFDNLVTFAHSIIQPTSLVTINLDAEDTVNNEPKSKRQKTEEEKDELIKINEEKNKKIEELTKENKDLLEGMEILQKKSAMIILEFRKEISKRLEETGNICALLQVENKALKEQLSQNAKILPDELGIQSNKLTLKNYYFENQSKALFEKIRELQNENLILKNKYKKLSEEMNQAKSNIAMLNQTNVSLLNENEFIVQALHFKNQMLYSTVKNYEKQIRELQASNTAPISDIGTNTGIMPPPEEVSTLFTEKNNLNVDLMPLINKNEFTDNEITNNSAPPIDQIDQVTLNPYSNTPPLSPASIAFFFRGIDKITETDELLDPFKLNNTFP